MIPAAEPPLRGKPQVSAEIRAQLLISALTDVDHIDADTRELKRQGPSYTLHTLQELSEEYGDESLCLLLGSDAFLNFTSWHQWQEIVQLCHLAVALRPGYQLTRQIRSHEALVDRYTEQSADLKNEPAGKILLLHMSQLEISSTRIRELIRSGIGVRFLTPDPVINIIEKRKLYHDN